VAAFLSPVLWAMEKPDRFDMYSCGVTLLQMVFPHLRNDNALIAFNKRLQVRAGSWSLACLNASLRSKLSDPTAETLAPKDCVG
jgi:hypothetical protein